MIQTDARRADNLESSYLGKPDLASVT